MFVVLDRKTVIMTVPPFIRVAWAITLTFLFASTAAVAEELKDRFDFWQSNAFECSVDAINFPSRPTGDNKQPCDDGDMTMFNGLLCYSGDERGCEGVRQAQDPVTGRWYRSPRIRLRGNDRGGADFSPDMAMGVQLYLIKTHDTARAEKWAEWLDKLTPCTLKGFGNSCLLYGIPRFCAPEQGCTMRPGDAASLAVTFDYLHSQFHMKPLPDGRLRGYLSTFKNWSGTTSELSAMFNRPGFPQHLAAVQILIMRGVNRGSSKIDDVASGLAGKPENDGNAFFSYVANRPRDEIVTKTLARCPAPNRLPTPPLHQWQWERAKADKAWEHSCYWDCIFMAHLLGM
ncbi:hypothetical protein [Mesorhizobium sp.]|uniref:hypothetical protein n=1 Tax=Mesorhizobium sp. TaxID=1871066 RepID=UPI000FE5E637|nr:hypothetical protein [Mesorhizobium sp.]RWB65419.1 MAG: hypothetical protein EOQ49_32185 [Mesorhizobium sp.]